MPEHSRIRGGRRSRRRRRLEPYMRESIVGLVIFLTLLALLAFMTWVVDVTGAAEPPLAAKEVAQHTQEVQPATFVVYAPPQEPEPTETPEPTVEELMEGGYLRDDIDLSYDLQAVAWNVAETFGIPHGILLAVMYEESRFDVDAVNYNETCFGLMQINRCNYEWLHETLAEYGATDIQNDPEDNILAGAYMLADLYGKYGDWHLALMAYNCGESGAKKQWDAGYYSSEYSRTVISLSFGG